MVKEEKKYTYYEHFRQTIVGESGTRENQYVAYEMTISQMELTDEEEAKLKDILREAVEKANAFLGW